MPHPVSPGNLTLDMVDKRKKGAPSKALPPILQDIDPFPVPIEAPVPKILDFKAK